MVERTTTDTAQMVLPPSAGPLNPGDTVAGKYVVTRVVGGGGMGQVVAATHVDLEQEVAIKIMLPDRAQGAESVERFLREARAASLLKSVHIARVFDVGKTEIGLPYIVMELLHGEDLVDVLAHGPLKYPAAVDAIIQACDAVAEAHAQGIIHRDLKPENLFLTRSRDGAPCVKVLDFGISKIAGTTARSRGRLVTEENTLLGSPSYMSPEHAKRSSSVDERSDIWSLGVTLYELTTGRDPFGAETAAEIFVNILTGSPPPPAAVNPSIPEGLSKVIMCCLEKDPAARFQSVSSLAAALSPYAGGETEATPASFKRPPSSQKIPGSLSDLASQPRYAPQVTARIDSGPMSSPRPVATTLFATPPKNRWIAPVLSVLIALAFVGIVGIVLFLRARHRVMPVAATPPPAAETATALPPPTPPETADTSASPPPVPAATTATTAATTSSVAPKTGAAPRAAAKPAFQPSPPSLPANRGAPTTPAIAPSAIPRERTSW